MDLDEVERETAVFGIPEDAEDAWREYGPGLIAELRAARDVVAAARHHWRVRADGCDICHAMAAYDATRV